MYKQTSSYINGLIVYSSKEVDVVMMMLTKHPNEPHAHEFKQYWLNMNRLHAPIKAVFFDWELTLARVLGDVSNTERLAALFQSQGLPFTLQEIQQAWEVYVKRQRPLRKAQSEQEIAKRDESFFKRQDGRH